MWTKTLLVILLFGCSTNSKDPIKNSKKLIQEGHASLYQNGAFAIPHTKIKLIPPGPDAIELAKELSGVKAKDSFLRYVSEVKASTVQIYTGTKASYQLAKDVDQNIARGLSELVPKLRKDSVLIMDASLARSKKIIAQSWSDAEKIQNKEKSWGKDIIKSTKEFKLKHKNYKGLDDFIIAYVELPSRLKKRGKRISDPASVDQFVETFKESGELRREYSKSSVYLIKDTFKSYSKDVNNSFLKAKSEFDHTDKYGVSLPLVQSVGWLVDGILWQGVIKPIGKLTAGAIGYTFVNGVAYPTYLVTSSGVTSTLIAVEVTKEAGIGVYNITAPTVELALSGIFYSGEYVLKEVSEKTTKGAALLVGNTLEYIGAPITKGLVGVGGSVSGVAVGVGGGVLAGSVRTSGEILAISSNLISKTAAGGVMATGVVVHTLKGTAEVMYEVSKATIVPPSLVLGSGLTLSYGSVSQLAGQSVLAVSDAAYLVLSLEGPSWVVYAVQGKLGEDISSNTIVDLKKMQEEGEEIRKVPVSDQEIERLLESLN